MTADQPHLQPPTGDERIAYFIGLVGLHAAEGALALLTHDEADTVRRLALLPLAPERISLIREQVIADVDLPRFRRGPGWFA